MAAATNYTASGIDFVIEADVDTAFDDDSYLKFKQALDLHTHRATYGLGVGRVGSVAPAVTGDVQITGDAFRWWGGSAGAIKTAADLDSTQELDGKTLDSSVGKGTWTASGTWTLPAFTLGGAVAGGSQNVSALGTIGSAAITVTSAAAAALAVGLNGATNPAFVVDAATGSQAAGLKITGAVAAGVVALAVVSSGSNAGLSLAAKGTGAINVKSGTFHTIDTYTPSGAGTATLDLSTGNVKHITMPAGNITVALSNENVGQWFTVRILQDGTGSRTVTWFTTIKWAGGVAPTLTTTANKADEFVFKITGAGTYDGHVVGQNI